VTPETVIERVNAEHHLDLRFGGRCPGGEVGAHYAVAADGARFVFKWFDDVTDDDWRLRIPARIERLRAKGYPAPRYLPPVIIDGGAVLIQEWVPGSWSDFVDQRTLDRVLVINEMQRGEGRGDRDWTEYIRWTLVEGADWYAVHDPLRWYSDETRRLLDHIESIGRALGPLPEGDLVHFDLSHHNVLRGDAGSFYVVDNDATDDGHRHYDLVTFALSLRVAGLDPGVAAGVQPGVDERLWEYLEANVDAGPLAAYVAHMVLRRAEWKIRHHHPKPEIDALLPRLAGKLDRYG
jgi:hypothetical protein